jgi:hypothetical protein
MRVRDRVLVSFSGDEELFYRNGSSGQLKAYLLNSVINGTPQSISFLRFQDNLFVKTGPIAP